MENFSLRRNLIAAYRDIVEGGKPQLLFYVKSKWSRGEIVSNFKCKIKKKYSDTEQKFEDGTRFYGFIIRNCLKLLFCKTKLFIKVRYMQWFLQLRHLL